VPKNRVVSDGIEYMIIRDPSTTVLAFGAGKFDRTE
jgi:ABC-type oligopeptide transport system substrate-binding subunit